MLKILCGARLVWILGEKIADKFISLNNLVCLNKGDGTHLNPNGSFSHLDIALSTPSLAATLDCNIFEDSWGSDHFPLIITFSLINFNSNFLPPNSFNYSKADWVNFSLALEEHQNFQDTITDPALAYDNLLRFFTKARGEHIPLHKGPFNHIYTPFWNSDCSKAKVEKKQP